MTIPLPLETERLTIRAFEAQDGAATALLEEYRRAQDEHGFSTCADAAFAHLPRRRLVAKVELENERSLRLAERLGMRSVGTISVDGRPHVLLALEQP